MGQEKAMTGGWVDHVRRLARDSQCACRPVEVALQYGCAGTNMGWRLVRFLFCFFVYSRFFGVQEAVLVVDVGVLRSCLRPSCMVTAMVTANLFGTATFAQLCDGELVVATCLS